MADQGHLEPTARHQRRILSGRCHNDRPSTLRYQSFAGRVLFTHTRDTQKSGVIVRGRLKGKKLNLDFVFVPHYNIDHALSIR